MEKSIESVWKEGFLKDETLLAPRITNLYDQKSKNIVERIHRLTRFNVRLIIVSSTIILIWWYLMGVPLIGAFIFVLMMSLAFYSWRQMKGLHKIDPGANSYSYLKLVDQWLKISLKKNVRIMRFFYPIMFVASFATIWFTPGRDKVMEKWLVSHPNVALIAGIPWFVWAIVLSLVSIMLIFADRIYRFDVNLIYGKAFKKLEEIISDLETLRS